MSRSLAALHRRLCAALCCLGVGAGAFAQDRRERDDVTVPPPQPMPQEMKVARGEEVLIPLRIHGQRNQVLTFLIRKLPRTGRVGVPKNTTANAAVVQYRPTTDRSVTSDVFEYAVKSTEGVSAPVPVKIEIIDQPPQLAGPAEVLFPPQLTGVTEVQTIELINRGGMMAEGECAVAPPWRLESEPKYRVDPDGRLFVKIAFAPEKAGDFLGELRLSSQPDFAVILRGVAQEALAVKPSPLRLAADPTTLVRTGVFEVTNHTGAAQTVRILGSERLHHERAVQLEPGRSAPIMVRTAAEDAAPLETELILEAGEYRAKLPVSAPPLPAVIRAVERTVDLGLVPGGAGGVGQLTLRNSGGVSGWAVVTTQPPFRVDGQRIELAPGTGVPVPIVVDGSGAGAVEQTLQVRTAGGTFSVPVRAIVIAPGSAPSGLPPTSSELPSLTSRPMATPMPNSVHDLDGGRPDSRLAVRPILREPTRCVLEWHPDLSLASKFVAERRELGLDAGKLAVRWVSMPGFSIERIGSNVRGRFEQLHPGTRYTVRVLGVDGDKRERVFETTFQTTTGKAGRGKSGFVIALLLVGALLGGAAVWKRRRSPVKKKRAAVLKKTQRIV